MSSSTFRDDYRLRLTDWVLETPHDNECTADQNWKILKDCILKTGEETVGQARKTQPDWFLESSEVLHPLIEAKNRAHNHMLKSNSITSQKEFSRHQRILVKDIVDKAKEWIKKTAQEGEKAVKDSRMRWKSIRKLHVGRKLGRSTAVLKEDGVLTKNPEEVRLHWHRHFNKILNTGGIPCEFCEQEIDKSDPPTEEELESALGKLKKGKAGGKTEIAPELVPYGGAELWDRILELMREVWEEGKVVSNWTDAVIVPVPKKENLQSCDNWLGISLLYVVGKIFARIIQLKPSYQNLSVGLEGVVYSHYFCSKTVSGES